MHIKFAKIDFSCPHCGKEYDDRDDKYLNKCDKNIGGFVTIKCTCKKKFGMTYNYMGNAESFKLEKK